jgi:hypothetical protein
MAVVTRVPPCPPARLNMARLAGAGNRMRAPIVEKGDVDERRQANDAV